MPAAVSRACTPIGEGATATPTMTLPRYRGQRSRSRISTVACSSAESPASCTDVSGNVSGIPVAAATSLAIPTTESSSGRFASISRSRTASSSPNSDLKSAPTSASPGSTRIPEWSPEMRSSCGEHSMPSDSWPLRVRTERGSERVGTRAPGPAYGTRSPAFMLRTPATTVRSAPPASMRARQSFADSGWSETSSTRATTTPFNPSHGHSTDSACNPFADSRSPSASGERSTGQNSRSQDRTSLTCSTLRLELLEESHVVLPQDPDVRDAESDHRQAVVPSAERETRVSLRVVPDRFQDAGMDHSGSHRLDPTGEGARSAATPLAHETGHLHLRARLHEGEERRSELALALGAEQR